VSGVDQAQIVDYNLDTVNLPGILHRGGSLIIARNITRERDDAVGARLWET
jgi:hypothetical protein